MEEKYIVCLKFRMCSTYSRTHNITPKYTHHLMTKMVVIICSIDSRTGKQGLGERKTVQGRTQMLFALSAKYVAPRRACMHNAQCIVHATYVVEKQSLTHDPNHADHAE